MDDTFHVVCHDCPEEGVYSDRAAAVEARDAHVEGTDHRVSLENIAEPLH